MNDLCMRWRYFVSYPKESSTFSNFNVDTFSKYVKFYILSSNGEPILGTSRTEVDPVMDSDLDTESSDYDTDTGSITDFDSGSETDGEPMIVLDDGTVV